MGEWRAVPASCLGKSEGRRPMDTLWWQEMWEGTVDGQTAVQPQVKTRRSDFPMDQWDVLEEKEDPSQKGILLQRDGSTER